MVGFEAVPLFHVVGIDAEAVGDAEQRVAFADAVADEVPLGVGLGLRRRDDQLFARVEAGAAFEAVGLGDGRRGDVIFFRDGAERFAVFDAVAAPADPLVGGDVGDFGGEFLGGARGQMEFERGSSGVARRSSGGFSERSVSTSTSIVSATRRRSMARPGFTTSVVTGVSGIDLHAVVRGVLGDQRERENDGDVVLGFLGQHIAAVEFPEIGVAGAFDALLHVARAAIVSGHGQIPVAEKSVEIAEMLGGGAGGFFGILALVDPPGAAQSVLLAAVGDELPHAARAGT